MIYSMTRQPGYAGGQDQLRQTLAAVQYLGRLRMANFNQLTLDSLIGKWLEEYVYTVRL